MASNKTILCLMFVLGFASCWGLKLFNSAYYAPVVLSEPVKIEIAKGDSVSQIIEKLQAQNINVSAFWFKLIGLQKHVLTKLKTGEYELEPGLTLPAIIDLFVEGRSIHYSITFPEGLNFKEWLQALAQEPNLQHTLTQLDDKNVMAQFGNKNTHPEGQLFPDTYFFEKNATDISILARAHKKMQAVLNSEWNSRAENSAVKTPYEALILASLVEKETGSESERQLIAGVFSRRLKKGMLLQTDPSVIYGMGIAFHGNISSQDLVTPTPYNTYLNKGLPPTPIAMPGLNAIHAALHPDNGNALYFVAKGDGTSEFSATLADHNLAVKRYQGGKHD